MKIYLAGPCDTENRYNMVQIAKVFREYGGYEVYCPWELKIENAWDIPQEDWARKVFEADIKAIQECDTFVMITPGRESTAGSNWENGYVFSLNKPSYIIQINDSPTSLMTFCGCTFFLNSSLKNLYNDIFWLIERMKNNDFINYKQECKTILT